MAERDPILDRMIPYYATARGLAEAMQAHRESKAKKKAEEEKKKKKRQDIRKVRTKKGSQRGRLVWVSPWEARWTPEYKPPTLDRRGRALANKGNL